MAILTFVIGAILFAAGFGSLAYCVDLVPTEMGRLYAECGVIMLSASGVVFSLAALIVRLNRIFAPPRRKAKVAEVKAAPTPPTAPAPEDDDVNLNRSGHLPTLRAVEEAIAQPQSGPHVVGRYSAGGAQYVIYSDGAIEAETEEGGLRFASMDELKSYIANRQG
ncbi:MAG TPA: hypothetical protein VN715_02475 [Roseiarcus sp.]|nr:hypothetical protein [Roseiarcus sp.]